MPPKNNKDKTPRNETLQQIINQLDSQEVDLRSKTRQAAVKGDCFLCLLCVVNGLYWMAHNLKLNLEKRKKKVLSSFSANVLWISLGAGGVCLNLTCTNGTPQANKGFKWKRSLVKKVFIIASCVSTTANLNRS
ncbi:uncharacterized protein EV154DRAFT_487426 [Mucor mucedo]|uniref:uncharacterized protein n=1 Tax=Mucor mucedo TaxID=29922 RepID=UPI00222054AC|nr:uncharacterized protein EV154DRAFT_487426 [Mucor mucedo]KAI7873169.1 hypothetical protein EV154DRAFT_487426 [Mucor mucedo]